LECCSLIIYGLKCHLIPDRTTSAFMYNICSLGVALLKQCKRRSISPSTHVLARNASMVNDLSFIKRNVNALTHTEISLP
jgi:hypothetical protein